MQLLANATFFPEPKVALGKDLLYLFFSNQTRKVILHPWLTMCPLHAAIPVSINKGEMLAVSCPCTCFQQDIPSTYVRTWQDLEKLNALFGSNQSYTAQVLYTLEGSLAGQHSYLGR